MSTFHIKQGDTSPSMKAMLKDEAGIPVDLTGASVVLNMSDAYGQTLIDRATVVVSDAVAGVVRYDWVTDDTLVAGDHRAEFEVTFNTGKVETFPNTSDITVSIREEIG